MIIGKSEYEMQGLSHKMTRRTEASKSSSSSLFTGLGQGGLGSMRSLGLSHSRAFSKEFSVVQRTGEDAVNRSGEPVEAEEPDFLKTLNYELGNKKRDAADAAKTEASTGISDRGIIDFSELSYRIRFQTLSFLFKLLYGKHLIGGNGDMESLANEYLAANTATKNEYGYTYTYEEYEETSFSTQGKVVTADGRELDFAIDVTMSRSFVEQSSINLQTIQSPLLDPLVINLDGNVDSVSDQKFYFDLNSDGTEDSISMLNPGSGFLALDRNENGSVDDGSELFGTRTGHGFSELAEYDLDGNGWIDEADDIYDKLRIWCIEADGSRSLYTLKEKDVGAICVKYVGTDFSMKNASNRTNAVVRESGFYLREDGTPFTMQQLDLAM